MLTDLDRWTNYFLPTHSMSIETAPTQLHECADHPLLLSTLIFSMLIIGWAREIVRQHTCMKGGEAYSQTVGLNSFLFSTLKKLNFNLI